MKNKKIIIGIIMIIIGILFLVFREEKYNSEKRTNIFDITSSGAKAYNVKSYIKASYISSILANYRDNKKYGFYVVFDEGVQHIVYLKNDIAEKINTYLMNNPEKTYIINGITKKMPNDIYPYAKDFVKEWLDMYHDHEELEDSHSHEIDEKKFYEYFGYIYLDTTVYKYSDFLIYNIFIYTFIVAGLMFIFEFFYKNIIK